MFEAGQIRRIAPRYNGTYANDNGTGKVVRLMRAFSDGNDWYCTEDLESALNDCRCDIIIHVSRLARSPILQTFAVGVGVDW